MRVPPSALQAPTQAAAGAGLGRRIGEKSRPELAVGRAVPDLAQALLRRIAQRVMLVTALRKRRDATGKRAAVGGDVHERPRSPAQRPGRIIVGLPEAQSRFRSRPGCAEAHAEGAGNLLGLLEVAGIFPAQALEQGLIRPRHTDRLLLEEDEALQVDLLDADTGRNAHEGRQVSHRLLEAGEPGRDPWPVMPFALLQLAERPNIPENALEIILATNRLELCRVRGIE